MRITSTNVTARLLFTVALGVMGVAAGARAEQHATSAATADQVAAEKLALQIVNSPEVDAAEQKLKARWRALATATGGIPAEAERGLGAAVHEVAFSAALAAVSMDRGRASLVAIMTPPHTWFGISVPGSRLGFDNPDTSYRGMGLDPAVSYVIRGRRYGAGPLDTNISILDKQLHTISNLTAADMHFDADGRYTITLDAAQTANSANHIHLSPETDSLIIRNTIGDWHTQRFDDVSVERVGGAPLPPRASLQQLTERAAARIIGYEGLLNFFNRQAYRNPVNTLRAADGGHVQGILSSQLSIAGAYRIADDEALVVKVALGGARYFTIPAYTRWMITADFWHHTESLNNQQALPNPDGSYTFVIAPRDPGVYNWVDTVGVHEGTLFLRWQGLPATVAGAGPSAVARLVKIADLHSVLPATTRCVTSAQRRMQLAKRAAAFAHRYGE